VKEVTGTYTLRVEVKLMNFQRGRC
jgi:hypothetical protein